MLCFHQSPDTMNENQSTRARFCYLPEDLLISITASVVLSTGTVVLRSKSKGE